MKIFRYTLVPVTSVALLIIIGIASCTNESDITVNELRKHIKYLSSDELKGRQTGSEGDSLAAEYIRKELADYGFIPLSGDGFQRFMVISRLLAGENNILSTGASVFKNNTDYTPLAFSNEASLEAGVIFAGYGFNIDTDSLKWQDYKGLDVKGKWVLVLRGDPEPDNTASVYAPFSSDRDKAMVARDMGAAGILLVSGTVFDQEDKLEALNSTDFDAGIVAFHIKRNVADLILSSSGKSIADLEKKLNSTLTPSGFDSGFIVKGKAEVIREQNTTRNVAMMLQGNDEVLRNEYVIIGAHFDHLGMGGPGSSSRALDTTGVHGGADDNASGISLMLEMAQRIAAEKSNARTLICIAFSGEEMGLLGSKFFAENPGIDLGKVNAMINLDMVGRLNEEKTLQAGGVGTAAGLSELLISLNDTNLLSLSLMNEGYGPSDHSSFYGKDIPVLFFSTGAHLDYHTPGDTWDKINYDGMLTVSDLVYEVILKLSSEKERLSFREAGPKMDQSRQVRRRGITLGIMPDFAGNIKNGLRADFITPGKPASMGGMKKGDIITSINGMTINNIQDYMFRMSQLRHGQTISVEVLRNEEKLVLLIQL
jgi:Zn-dependent M28 family amino/carboxypeptidase